MQSSLRAPSKSTSSGRALRSLCFVFALLPAAAWAQHPASPAPQASVSKDESGSMGLEELERMLVPVLEGDADARKRGIDAVARLGPDAVPAITKKLAQLRKERAGGIFAALKLVKEAGRPGDGADLVDGLLRVQRSDGAGYKATLATAVLMRALVKIGTTPAARALVRIASAHDGALRPDVTRAVKVLGERAVPALIELRRAPEQDFKRWASVTLEALGKRIPGDAVQTTNSELLADVLRAYAEVHENDAVPVIISFVNTDRALVRQAARESILAFGGDALWKLREAYSNLTGKPPGDGWGPEQTAKELFSAYDRARLEEVYALLDQGLARQKEGKLELALADFDKVLARQPMLDRRAEMAPAYAARGEALVERSVSEALASYRKALRLEGTGPRAAKLQADIAFLEGKELQARGIADTEPFRRALALDPGHPGAQAELNRLDARSEERADHTRRYAAAGAVLALGIAGIFLFSGQSRPAPRRRDAIEG